MNKKNLFFVLLGLLTLNNVQAGPFDNLDKANEQNFKETIESIKTQAALLNDFKIPATGSSPFEQELATVSTHADNKTPGVNFTLALNTLNQKITDVEKSLEVIGKFEQVKAAINASKVLLPGAKTALIALLKPVEDAMNEGRKIQGKLPSYKTKITEIAAKVNVKPDPKPSPDKKDKDGKHPNGFASNETLESATKKLENISKMLEANKEAANGDLIQRITDFKTKVAAAGKTPESKTPGANNFVMEYESLKTEVKTALGNSEKVSKMAEKLKNNISLSNHITEKDKTELNKQLNSKQSEIDGAKSLAEKLKKAKGELNEAAKKLGIKDKEPKEEDYNYNGLIFPDAIVIPEASASVTPAFKTEVEAFIKPVKDIMEEEKSSEYLLLSQKYASFDATAQGAAFKQDFDNRVKKLNALIGAMNSIKGKAATQTNSEENVSWANDVNKVIYQYAKLEFDDLESGSVKGMKTAAPSLQFEKVPELKKEDDYLAQGAGGEAIPGFEGTVKPSKLTTSQVDQINKITAALNKNLPNDILKKFSDDFEAAKNSSDKKVALENFEKTNDPVMKNIEKARTEINKLLPLFTASKVRGAKGVTGAEAAFKALNDFAISPEFKKAESVIGRTAQPKGLKKAKEVFEGLDSQLKAAKGLPQATAPGKNNKK